MPAVEISGAGEAYAPAAPSRRRWLIAGILLLAVLSAFFDRISVAVLFTNQAFQADMGGLNPTQLGLLMTVFLFAYGASGVLFSFVGDLYGPRRGLAIGAALWGVAMALMGGAGGFSIMLAYRVLLGIAEGPQFSLTNALIKRWFPQREQARANSIWMVGSPLGSAIGFPLTIFIVSHYGWRASFYTLAGLNLLVILPLVLLFIKDRPAATAEAAPSIAARAEAVPYRAQVAAFMADWRFWMLVIFNSAALIYLWGLNSWLPTYLSQARHFDMRQVGNFAFFSFLMMFVGEVASAILSDRLGRRAAVCFVGLLMAGVSMYLVSIAEDPTQAALLVAVSAFFWGCALPPLFALSLQILPVGAVAAGVGVYNGVGNLVGALSPLLIGMLIQHFGGFDAGLMVLVGAAIIGSFAMLPLIRRY